jgi:hypothetical protein
MKHSSRSIVLLLLVLSVPIALRVFARPLNGVGMAQLPKQAGVTQMLEGAIDIHVHADPDSRGRFIDAIDVARLARSRGMRAIVLKNHYEPTASLAYITRKEVPGIEVFGGIALDLQVGGINPAAVENMARVKGGWGRIVWMPTLTSENAVRAFKLNEPFVSVSRNGKLLPEVNKVISLVANYGLVLATGHVSAEEALMIIREGHRQGLQHMVVTHAMEGPVWMNIPQMQEAASLGAFIEFDYNLDTVERLQKPADLSLHKDRDAFLTDYKEAIRALGPEHCIVSEELTFQSSDFDEHLDGVGPFVVRLGLNEHEVDLVLKQNPARLLGLTARAGAQSAIAAATQESGAASSSAKSSILDFEFFKTCFQTTFLKKRPGHARCYVCYDSANPAFRLVKMSNTRWSLTGIAAQL